MAGKRKRNLPEVIFKKTKEIPSLTEEIFDYISEEELDNPFIEGHFKDDDPYREFARLLRSNLGFAVKAIIGDGSFELLPFQLVVLRQLWDKTFPIFIASRGGGKTFLLAIYAILKAVLNQNTISGTRIVVVGPSFRQSQAIMQKIDDLMKISPLLRDCTDTPEGIVRSPTAWYVKFGNSTITALPLGDGTRIRGQRADVILCDETANMPQQIFDVVIRGFAAVSSDPINKVRSEFRRKKLIKLGIEEGALPERPKGNQIIRAGSASYEFNHFFKTYQLYKKIIGHKILGYGGDQRVKEIFGEAFPADQWIDYRNYGIVQLPYKAFPTGYIDDTMVADARLNMTEDEFNMEYNGKFISDSAGFFKASAIEGATPKMNEVGYFEIETVGDPGYQYVMGLDPARLDDDFGLVILKITPQGNQLVYCHRWEKKNFGIITKEIRRLCKVFNIRRVGIDQAGGGSAIMDFLQTPEMIPAGELPFWEIDSNEVAAGIKILDMVVYQGSWIRNANYDLAADIEQRRVLFPYSNVSPPNKQELYEDIFDNIQICKAQLRSIERTVTPKGEIEHFDVPINVKKKSKKDIYSALLIAAYEARMIKGASVRQTTMGEDSIGGFVEDFCQADEDDFSLGGGYGGYGGWR